MRSTEPAKAGLEGPNLPASRHYQRAKHDRGAETRERLIHAALDAFGRYGFDGAATREIARKADANLAAIAYHFGSKEALHRAVAEHVIAEINVRTGVVLASVKAELDAGETSRPAARRMLQRLVESHFATLLGEKDAELWARFIIREQMEPSPVYEVLYEFMASGHATARRLVALLLGIDPASDEASLRTFMLTGQIVAFRVVHPMVLRTLGRDRITEDDRAMIMRIASDHIDRMVGVPLEETAIS